MLAIPIHMAMGALKTLYLNLVLQFQNGKTLLNQRMEKISD